MIRKRDRLRLPDRPDQTTPSYLFESLDFPVTDRKMEAFFAEFPLQSKPSEPHRHEGAELIYVIKGQLVVNIDGDDVALDSGRRDVFRLKRAAQLSPGRPLVVLGNCCHRRNVACPMLAGSRPNHSGLQFISGNELAASVVKIDPRYSRADAWISTITSLRRRKGRVQGGL